MKSFKFTKKNAEIESVVTNLETKYGLKLKAINENDVVNGHVNIRGNEVEVVIYDKDELANQEHKTTFKKPKTIPTIKEADL